MIKKAAFLAVVFFCVVSMPVFFYIMAMGIFAIWEDWGLGAGSAIVALSIPSFFGIALLVDGREARSQSRQTDPP